MSCTVVHASAQAVIVCDATIKSFQDANRYLYYYVMKNQPKGFDYIRQFFPSADKRASNSGHMSI